MKYEIKAVNSVRKEIVASIEKADILDEEAKVLKQFRNEVKIPGFRQGKVPDSIIKSRFSKEIEEQVNKTIANDTLNEITEKEKLNLFALVKFDVNNEDSGAKTITFTVDLKPEVKLLDYKNISISEPEITVSEEEVNEGIEQIRNHNATYNEVHRPAQKGDFVRLAYEGKFEDGKPVVSVLKKFPVWGQQKNTWEEAGNTEAPGIKAIIEGIVGMSANEEKDFDMEFPEDFHVAELKNKKVTYHVQVFEVREKVLPEVDEAFLAKLKVNSLDELKEQVRNDLRMQKMQKMRFEQREELVQKLIESVDFEIPESAVEMEQIRVLRSFMERQFNFGFAPEMFEEKKDELISDAKEIAVDKAKINFVLDKIAEIEKIQVTDQEMNQMIIQEASMLRTSPDKLIADLKGNRERIQDLQRRAIFGKTLDFILVSNLKSAENSEQNSEEEASKEASPEENKDNK